MKKAQAFDSTPQFEHFKGVMKRLVSVPKTELDEQIRLHDDQARKNPNRRGPKPKTAKRRPTKTPQKRKSPGR